MMRSIRYLFDFNDKVKKRLKFSLSALFCIILLTVLLNQNNIKISCSTDRYIFVSAKERSSYYLMYVIPFEEYGDVSGEELISEMTLMNIASTYNAVKGTIPKMPKRTLAEFEICSTLNGKRIFSAKTL